MTVSIVWIYVALLVGCAIGMLVMAMCQAAGRGKEADFGFCKTCGTITPNQDRFCDKCKQRGARAGVFA